MKRQKRRGRDEDDVPAWLEWLMLVLAVSMLPLVVVQEIAEDPGVVAGAERASAAIWFAFLTEYVYLLVRAPRRKEFVRTHWFDLAIIVLTPPIFVFDDMQAFRALRAARLLRAIAVVGRAQHTMRRYVRRSSLPYLIALAVLVVLVGGLTISILEPDRAHDLWDGVWWAAATLSTVGYGDIAPATFAGRALAMIVMLVGIGTFAALTAAVASYFVEADESDEGKQLETLTRDIAELRASVASLTAELRRHQPNGTR